ncbi:type II toxin-antitoxin system ParD family antitoxin [Rhodospirillum sp. A1_3_36]|uniref:type II toxin-antitoxin system ParD family antitoxin n=1 Tax=Rhodospirillum sp. A1_3_36 TaxID=3391666 RepID=UPI0039A59CC0
MTLAPELEQRVREKVASGAYPTADAVIQAGLSLLDDEERKLQALRAGIQEARDQIERGGYVEFEENDFVARMHGNTPDHQS